MLSRVLSFLVLYLANCISKWLGKPLHHFIGFDRAVRLLRVGFTGITIQLRNVRLLQGWNAVLLRAGLPFQIKIGLIEQVKVRIGFISAISVEVGGVYMVAMTTTDKFYDAEEERKQELVRKRNRLKDFGHDGTTSSETQQSSGWFSRQLQKFINWMLHTVSRRLKVSVTDVHLRLEDSVSGEDKVLVAGTAMEKLLVTSSPSTATIKGGRSVLKHMDVSQFSVYWNCPSVSEDLTTEQQDTPTLLTKHKSFPFSNAVGYDYLLKPLSLSAELELSQTGKHTLVGVDVECQDQVFARVSQDQLLLLVRLLSFIKHQNNVRHIAKFRPSQPPRGAAAKEWWQFAFQSVVFYLRERRGRQIWDIMLQRSLGKEYCDLYMKFLMPCKLTRQEKARIQELEDDMDLLGVMVSRSKVWRELKLRRLLMELAEYSAAKSKDKEEVLKIKTEKDTSLSTNLAFKCNGIQFILQDDERHHSRPILAFTGGQINTSFSQWPRLSFGLSMSSVTVNGCGQSSDKPGPIILQCVPQKISPSPDSAPIINLKFSQPDPSDRMVPKGGGGSGGQSAGDSLVVHHDVKVCLEQTVLVVDTKTALEIVRVMRVLLDNASSEFEKSLKEQSYNLMWKGKKRMEGVLTTRELVSVTADVKIPTLVFPRLSDRQSHGAVVLNPGQLTLATSTPHIKKANMPAIQYDAKLLGMSISLTPAEGELEKLVASRIPNSQELLTCREAFAKTVALVNVSPERISIPKMEVLGNVPTVGVSLSETTMETLLHESVSYVALVSRAQHMSVAVVQEQHSRKELFHRCSVSQQADQLMECHVVEITDQVQNRATSLGKQAMESGLTARNSTTVIQITVDVSKMLADISARENDGVHSLHTEMNLVSVKLVQNVDSQKVQLDIGSIAVDSASPGRGFAPTRTLSTHYNENGRFLSVGMCKADPSVYVPFLKEHQMTKLKGFIELAPLDLFLSDTLCSSWTKIAVNNYTRISSMNLTEFKSLKPSRPPKQATKTSKKEIQVKQYEVSRGIIAFSFSAFLKEISVAYIRAGNPLARLSMCGLAAEVRDSIVALECAGSVDSISLIDPLQTNEADTRAIFSDDLERVLKFKSKMKTPLPSLDKPRTLVTTYSRPIMDPDNINVNLSAVITVGGVSFHLLSAFIFSLQESLVELQQDVMKTLQPVLAVTEPPPQGPRAAPKGPIKFHLSVNVHTITVTVPEGVASEDILEVCLESLLLSNKYTVVELSGERGASYYPLGETIQMDFHQLSINRKDDEDSYRLVRIPDATVLFSHIVSRGIPLQALSSEPFFKVSFMSPKFELDTTNVDIISALKILQGNFKGRHSSAVHPAVTEKDRTSSASKNGEVKFNIGTEEADVPLEVHQRSLLQLDLDVSFMEWHLTYVSVEEHQKDDPSLLLHHSISVLLATKLVLDNFMCSLSVQSDASFAAECWVMDAYLKEVVYSANRRRSSSYDTHRASLSSESYILHQNLHYRKTKPPKFGGGTMDTRRASSKDVVLQARVDFSKNFMKVGLMMQHLHMCLQSQLLSQSLKILSDLQSAAHGVQGQQQGEVTVPGVVKEENPKPQSEFSLDIQLHLDHSSVALSDKPSEVVSYGMCAEVSSTIGCGPANLHLSYSARETRVSADPLPFSMSLVQFGHNMIKLGQVIEPCAIKAAYVLKETDEEGVLEECVRVELSELVLSLTVEAMFSLIRPLSLIKLGQNVKETAAEPEVFPKHNPWEMEKIDMDHLELPIVHSGSAEVQEQVPKAVRKIQKANVKLPEIIMNFEIIFAGSNSSVLTVTSMLEMAASSWSSKLEVDTHLELCSHVFNRHAGAWEPLIEPIENPVMNRFDRWALSMKARSLSSSEVESASSHLRHRGSTSSSSSRSEEEAAGIDSRKLSASEALKAATASLLNAHDKTSVSSGDSISVGSTGVDVSGGKVAGKEGGGDSDSVFESLPGGDRASRTGSINVGGAGEKQALVLIITSDSRMELSLSPGAVETLYDFKKAFEQKNSEMTRNLAKCSNRDQIPLQIRNETGLELNIFPGQTFAVGHPGFENTVHMIPTRRSLDTMIPLTTQRPLEKSLSSSSLPGGNSITVLGSNSLGRMGTGNSVTVNSWVVDLLYSSKDRRIADEERTVPLLAREKARVKSDGGEVIDELADEDEDISSYLMSAVEEEGEDDVDSPEHKNCLLMLQEYLKERKKRKLKKCVECEELSGSCWLPRSLHHRIRVQARGGMKSSPIAISMPGCTLIPLYDFSFGGGRNAGSRKGSTSSSNEARYGRKMLGVCEVTDENGTRVVTIRSALQIKSEFPQIISMYDQAENNTLLMHEIHPGEVYNPPVSFYTSRNPLKLGIGHNGLFGEDVLEWGEMLKSTAPVYISCPSGLSLNQNRIYIQVVMSNQSVVSTVGKLDKPFHLLTFKPALVVHNLLPMKVSIKLDTSECDKREEESRSAVSVAPGKMETMFHVDPTSENKFSIEIESYRGLKWKGFFTPDNNNSKNFYSTVKLHSYSASGEKIDKMKFGLYSDASQPSMHRLYCPYWIVNATTLRLEYEHQTKKRLLWTNKILDSHEVDSVTLVYFKNEVDKKDRKVKIRMKGSSQWSKSISLESAGQSESVTIKAKDLKSYELAVHDSSLLNILTRVVHIYPSVVLYNSTKVGLQVGTWKEDKQEVAADTCVTIEPNDVRVFWPDSHKSVAIRMRDVSGQWVTASPPFNLSVIGSFAMHTTIVTHELPALTVDVSSNRVGAALSVNLLPYVEGSAPYQLENFSSSSIKIRQKSSSKELVVPPCTRQLYTWDFPLREHILEWQLDGEQDHHWIAATDRGSRIVVKKSSREKGKDAGEGPSEVYWTVSYEGTQKVFQVFDNVGRYNTAIKASRARRLLSGMVGDSDSSGGGGSFYMYCSMEGFGVSLLNNRPKEVLYCSLTSSPAVWLKKSKAGSRFRVLQEENLLDAEHAWRSGLPEVEIDSEKFNLNTLTGSQGSMLTRTFNPGLWASVSLSEEHIAIGVALGRLQVDNQLRYYVLKNRIVLAPEKVWDPEKAIAPVVDSEVVIRRPGGGKQQVLIVKNAYLKIQNLQVNVELGVLASIFPLVDILLAYDVESHFFAFKTPSELNTVASKVMVESPAPNALFQNLSISGFKVIVTYSTINDTHEDLSKVLGRVVEVLLALIPIFSNGSVTIVLDSLKFKSESGSARQLYQAIYGHYKQEILSQFYSFFLGLDLIGNPSRILSNFELGINDLIEETRKGLEDDKVSSGIVGVAVGVKDLLGHVVEGSAGSLVSATGTFRTSLLETTDLDYKRKHRQLQHETSETLLANLSLGARFFAEGILGGITSIFVDPITGARKSGAEGFLKGLGRGALSVLTKPTLGVVDLAYFTLEGIRSSVDDDISNQTIRLPRLIHPDRVLRPFKLHDAQGLHILWHNEESEGTYYYTHHFLPATEDMKSPPRLILVNSARIMKLRKSSKSFKLDNLCIKLEHLQGFDAVTDDSTNTPSLFLKYEEDHVIEKIGSFFGKRPGDHNAEEISIPLDSASTAEVLVCKITEACENIMLNCNALSSTS